MRCPNGHESQATDYCDTCGEAMGSGADVAASTGAPSAGGSGNALDLGGSPGPAAPGPAAPGPAAPGPASGAAGDQVCPNCGTAAVADALFCEGCGYDYTTGSMPRRAAEVAPEATAVGIPDAAPAAVGSLPDDAGGEPETAAGGTPAAGAMGVGDLPSPGAGGPGAAPDTGGPGPTSRSNTSTSLDQPWVAELWIDPEWYASQESPDQLPSAGLPTVVALRNSSLLIGRFSRSRDIHPDIDCGADNGVSRRHAQLTTDGRRWWVEDLQSANGTFIGDAVGVLPTVPIPVGQKREVDADDRVYVGSWTRIVIRPAVEGEV